MDIKNIKVVAVEGFVQYRNQVLGLAKKDFRALQAGKEATIPLSTYEEYSKIFKKVEVKKKEIQGEYNGN